MVSDHGESFGEDGSLGHGKRLTPYQIHVPLFVRSPGVKPGISERTVGSVDVAATLLSLGGVDPRSVPGFPAGSRDLTEGERDGGVAFGMRRTFVTPREDVRLDGRFHLVDGYEFYIARGEEIVRGNGEALEPGAGIATAREDRIRKLFAFFEQEAKGHGAEDLLDAGTTRGLEALGYIR